MGSGFFLALYLKYSIIRSPAATTIYPKNEKSSKVVKGEFTKFSQKFWLEKAIPIPICIKAVIP